MIFFSWFVRFECLLKHLPQSLHGQDLRIHYMTVSLFWTQNRKLCLTHCICAVFLQFDFSEGQKDDILYCIYYICKVSLQYRFTDYLQNDFCDWRLWHINYIYVVLPNVQSKLAKLYLYDFSLVWVLWWIRRPETWLKTLSHMLHL